MPIKAPPLMYCLSIFFMRGRQAINIIIAAPPKRIASTHIGVMLSSAVFKITNELPHISVVHMRQMRPIAALFWFFIIYIFTICNAAARSISFLTVPLSNSISIR